MNAKTIALTITFSVLAIILNPFKIPAVILPGFSFYIYEIPIVIAFFLFGFKIGFLAGILHLMGQIFFFPGPIGGIGAPMGLVAVLNMMLGVYVANNIINPGAGKKSNIGYKRVVYLTAFGILFRAIISPILDYFILWHFLAPIAIGQIIPEWYILSLVPGMVLFNVIIPLYTIPISYLIARKVNTRFDIGSMNIKPGVWTLIRSKHRMLKPKTYFTSKNF